MQTQYDGRAENRGTILVASSHTLFTDLVGEMVVRCGFAAAYPAGREPSWLSLTRTQPCVVICDCSAPADGIQRLITEASARQIPLVLSDARMKQRAEEGSLVLPQQVAWLTFPVSRDAFAALIDTVLRPVDVGPANRPVAVKSDAPSKPARRLALVRRDHDDDETPTAADARDLRSAVAAALAAKPVYAESLRRAVWTYVCAERDAGSSPADVIVSLTELVEDARMVPASVSRALTARVILWCVEAYFGQLGSDVGRAPNSAASQPADSGAATTAAVDSPEILVEALPA
jgi:hypothetical protein